MPPPAGAYTSQGRCGDGCTFHLHGDPRVGLSLACGNCAIHIHCAEHIRTCTACRIPLEGLDTDVFERCNIGKCRRRGGLVCSGCLASIVARFEKHVAVMATLPLCSCDAWLRTNGGLRHRDNSVVVRFILNLLLEHSTAGFIVRRTDSGVEHFSEHLARVAGRISEPMLFTELIALDPALPPEAASTIRRFVSERRRHWQEVPGKRAVVSLGSHAIQSVREIVRSSSTLLCPARLVGMAPSTADTLRRMKRAGKLHEFGRSVFYWNAQAAPATSAESRRRVRRWKAALRRSQQSSPQTR